MPGREDPRLGDLGDRLVLIRRCYLNPVAFAAHRPVFTRAAFSVIDWPPLTAQGKTSTDIHMVMDILDKGIAYRNGFGPDLPKDAASLASVHADNVLELAAAAQLPLTQQERKRVVHWLTGGLR